MRSQIRAVIFDCDGVLINSEEIGLDIELEHLRQIGLNYERAEYLLVHLGSSWQAFHERIAADLLARTGRPLPADFRDSLALKLRAAFEAKLEAIEGAAELVEALSLPKAVASSSLEASLRWKLAKTGLAPAFGDHLYSSEQVTRGKPAPDLFLLAAARLEAPAAATLVVEDSVNGIRAAVAAGMIAAGFIGGGHCGAGHGDTLRAAGAAMIFDSHAALRRFVGSETA